MDYSRAVGAHGRPLQYKTDIQTETGYQIDDEIREIIQKKGDAP